MSPTCGEATELVSPVTSTHSHTAFGRRKGDRTIGRRTPGHRHVHSSGRVLSPSCGLYRPLSTNPTAEPTDLVDSGRRWAQSPSQIATSHAGVVELHQRVDGRDYARDATRGAERRLHVEAERSRRVSVIVGHHRLMLENLVLPCGNAFSGSLDVVGDHRSRPDFLRTTCGPLGIRPLGDRLFDPARVPANADDSEHLDPVLANQVDGQVREPLEQHPTRHDSNRMAPDSGNISIALDLLVQPCFEPTRQRRVEPLVVVIDRREVVFHPRVEDEGPPSHALRAGSRGLSSSQVSPIDGSP